MLRKRELPWNVRIAQAQLWEKLELLQTHQMGEGAIKKTKNTSHSPQTLEASFLTGVNAERSNPKQNRTIGRGGWDGTFKAPSIASAGQG